MVMRIAIIREQECERGRKLEMSTHMAVRHLQSQPEATGTTMASPLCHDVPSHPPRQARISVRIRYLRCRSTAGPMATPWGAGFMSSVS